MASGGASGEKFTSIPQCWGLSSGDFDMLFGGGAMESSPQSLPMLLPSFGAGSHRDLGHQLHDASRSVSRRW